ncbi:site-specific DNA-cytosine methylase [Streptomyces sp. LBL]|uniref:DNA cytosine methyltransferase n=1 Tax=Streptomyces sp. LBL TaxID=2940562 RepID=UPI002476B6D4|nr:DNA cytosine methyltransferase [Streptomyces sp. LBL]MDH6629389.1 site-specific DNA-cytosine methylase [Streptomyces sp. LBL]
MRTLPAKVQTAVHVATLARKAGRPIPAKVLPILEEAAAPWPAEWLLAPLPGDPIRIVELFAGPGGWSEGIATVLGVAVDAVGIDVSKDACATATAAGHFRICADITTLDPEHYALRHVRGLIVSPPCPCFSPAGKHSGQEQANIDVLCRVIAQTSEAGGFLPGNELDDWCEGCDTCDELGYHDGFAPRSGVTWDELRAQLAPLTDARIGLMAELLFWAFGLQAGGAPLQFIAMEQSSRLPQQILDDIRLELRGGQEEGEWYWSTQGVLEASEFGLASRRERVFFLASRRLSYLPEPAENVRRTTMAQALGWKEGERINTRGVRPLDPATGRPKGGNEFSADKPSNCLTGKARTWKRVSDGLRLTQNEAGTLVGFRASYPWFGSRTSAFQQEADVVPPLMAALVLAQFFGVDGTARAADYLFQLYRMDELTGNAEDFDTAA